MQLSLYDSDQSLSLSNLYKIEVGQTKYDRNVRPYYNRPGGFASGGFAPGPTSITLKHETYGTDDAEFVEHERAVRVFLRNAEPPVYLKMVPDSGPALRREIDRDSITDKAPPGQFMRLHEREIILASLDADWEEDAETSVGPVVLTNDQTVQADNTGDALTYPVISVTAIDNLLEFTLSNAHPKIELFITIKDNSFTAGKRYELDFKQGLIRLYGVGGGAPVERSAAVFDGGQFALGRGVNDLIFNAPSGSVSVSLQYRNIRLL